MAERVTDERLAAMCRAHEVDGTEYGRTCAVTECLLALDLRDARAERDRLRIRLATCVHALEMMGESERKVAELHAAITDRILRGREGGSGGR